MARFTVTSQPPDAFLSYTRFDDRRGQISAFREHLEDAVREVTGQPFQIFQDVDDIEIGERWSDKLDEILAEAHFFIPILTPSYFTSPACRDELSAFLEAKKGPDGETSFCRSIISDAARSKIKNLDKPTSWRAPSISVRDGTGGNFVTTLSEIERCAGS